MLRSLLFSNYKVTRGSTQPVNMRDIVFERAKGRGVTVNRMAQYVETVVRWGSISKMFWKISQNLHEKVCDTPTQIFLVIFANFVRTPFLQNTTGRLLLTIAVSIAVSSERGIFKRHCISRNFFSPFKPFTILKFDMTKYLGHALPMFSCHCFFSHSFMLFLWWKGSFCNIVHTSNFYWRWGFDTDKMK